jgi:hypothetical protein
MVLLNPFTLVLHSIKCCSKLHKIVAQSIVFPCGESISRNIGHTDVDDKIIVDAQRKATSSIRPSVLITLYKLTNKEIELNEDWVKEFPLKLEML